MLTQSRQARCLVKGFVRVRCTRAGNKDGVGLPVRGMNRLSRLSYVQIGIA
ncbi:hypothetical protein D3C79_1009410 [compost metagenome]